MKNTFFLVLLSSILSASLFAKEVTPKEILEPSPLFAKPGSIFTLKDTGESSLFQAMRELDRAKEIGIGTILISLPHEDQTFWKNWKKITKRAQQLQLHVGFTDFQLQKEKAPDFPCAWKAEKLGTVTNLQTWVQQHPLQSNEIARIACSNTSSNQLNLAAIGKELPTQGVWEVTGFIRQSVTNQASIPFQTEKFGAHINHILSKSQTEIPRQYDITVKWYHFPSMIPPDELWPMGNEKPAFPLRYWERESSNQKWMPTAFLASKSKSLWISSFAEVIRDLVQEAGLEASMDIANTPLPPEELSIYLKRPIFPLATNDAERIRNLRVSSGGRVMDRPQIIGQLTWPLPIAETAKLHTFPWKPFADSLLADGATFLLLDLPDGLPSEDNQFKELRTGCQYIHRCQRLLEMGSNEQDYLYIGEVPESLQNLYSIDSITPAMLQGVRIKNHELVFPSGWTYQRLLVNPREIQNNPKLQKKLISFSRAGVPVFVCWIGQQIQTPPVEGLKAIHSLPELKRPPKITTQSDNAKLSIRWIHKQNGKQAIYFLVNSSDQSGNVRLTFRAPARQIQCWNPEGTDIKSLPIEKRHSCLFFMEPAEALFFIVK